MQLYMSGTYGRNPQSVVAKRPFCYDVCRGSTCRRRKPRMTKIIRSEDCGNSPKNKFVEDLEVAFAEQDLDFILNSVTDDIIWKVAGQVTTEGKEELLQWLQQAENDKVDEVRITHAITHGKTGAANGTRKLKNKTVSEFCTFYEFNNAKASKVKEIVHYEVAVR
jgi:hypothetical protein